MTPIALEESRVISGKQDITPEVEDVLKHLRAGMITEAGKQLEGLIHMLDGLLGPRKHSKNNGRRIVSRAEKLGIGTVAVRQLLRSARSARRSLPNGATAQHAMEKALSEWKASRE
jgi:hypothetical protein